MFQQFPSPATNYSDFYGQKSNRQERGPVSSFWETHVYFETFIELLESNFDEHDLLAIFDFFLSC